MAAAAHRPHQADPVTFTFITSSHSSSVCFRNGLSLVIPAAQTAKSYAAWQSNQRRTAERSPTSSAAWLGASVSHPAAEKHSTMARAKPP